MEISPFYDERTGSISYLVWDKESRIAVLIDPVLDFEPEAARLFTDSAERIARQIDRDQLSLKFVLDTHAHADHLTALTWFKNRYGAETVIGADISTIQKRFAPLFGASDAPTDGRPFDRLLQDRESLDVGPFQIDAIPTPGHTPASLSYLIGDALFVGDTLFQPDAGTARCDFPGGSAGELYDSIHRLFKLPNETRTFTLHDYRPGGRELQYESSIGEQRRTNIHINECVSREEFIALRERLDRDKPVPRLILPALQINIRAGEMPPTENGQRFIRLPINVFEKDSKDE